jgi:surface polysaccharide O-acyltransferase-like enzyme
MVMVVGNYIRGRLEAGQPFHRDVLLAAGAMLFIGLGSGRVVGWREISDLPIPGPPQFWYLATVSGIMLLVLVAIDRRTIRAVDQVLEGIGRSALSIYVAHGFVFPAVALLRYLFPVVPDLIGILAAMAVFLAFVAYKVWPKPPSQSPHDRARDTAGHAPST